MRLSKVSVRAARVLGLRILGLGMLGLGVLGLGVRGGACHADDAPHSPYETPPAATTLAAATLERLAALVAQLNDDDAARREAAQHELIAGVPSQSYAQGVRYLEAIPAPTSAMPPEVRQRLQRVRREIQLQLTRQAYAASRVTIDVEEATLSEVLVEFERQTGNQLTDLRAQFGQPADEKRVSLQADNLPFWEALDLLLDEADMVPYAYAGEEKLALIQRSPGAARRTRRGSYVGPFRVEAVALNARRDFRIPEQSQLRLELEFAWEPRLQPIAISQPASGIRAELRDGLEIPLASPQALFQIEAPPGSHAAELIVPLQLPARDDLEIVRLRGAFTALIPGRQAEFVFANLETSAPTSQTIGGVTVFVDRVRRNQDLWEVAMRLRVEGDETGLESHRGWVFQNPAVLTKDSGADSEGERG
jgi:hypothetical protein